MPLLRYFVFIQKYYVTCSSALAVLKRGNIRSYFWWTLSASTHSTHLEFYLHTTVESHLTVGNSWTDLQNVWHLTITPPTEFKLHTTVESHLTLGNSWTDLQYVWHLTIPPPALSFISIQQWKAIGPWGTPEPWVTPSKCLSSDDDSTHDHTTMVRNLTLGDSWWPWTDLQNVWYLTMSPSTKFHDHTSSFSLAIWPRVTPYNLEPHLNPGNSLFGGCVNYIFK